MCRSCLFGRRDLGRLDPRAAQLMVVIFVSIICSDLLHWEATVNIMHDSMHGTESVIAAQ